MANPSSSMDFLGMLRNKLEEAPPDAFREIVSSTIQLLYVGQGRRPLRRRVRRTQLERSDERINSRKTDKGEREVCRRG